MGQLTLRSIAFSELLGRDLGWTLDKLTLNHINLLVGKNATGKSRVLNVIGNLARQLLQGELRTMNFDWDVVFEEQEVSGAIKTVRCELRAVDGKMEYERVSIDGVVQLERSKAGILKIKAVQLNQEISYRPSSSEVATVSRRDELQYPFLNPIHEWATAVRSYHFGSQLGKDNFGIGVQKTSSIVQIPEVDDSNEDQVVPIFDRGRKQFENTFVQAIIADMGSLGYRLSSIDISEPSNLIIKAPVPLPGKLGAIGVQEEGIQGTYHQNSMSQGMFRALSILVQVNYSQMANRANCILIDDIGEGLDFERSSKLIDVLREKSRNSRFQLIMSTNDQFVMNHVPLEEWSVLHRNGSHVSVFNKDNAAARFEEFKFIGMSNFTFFETDFANSAVMQECETVTNE